MKQLPTATLFLFVGITSCATGTKIESEPAAPVANTTRPQSRQRWQQDFDFYISETDEKIASVVVDLGAAAHVPVRSHPLLLQVRVTFQISHPRGLRDGREADVMGRVEDELVEAMESKLNAIYVGRVVKNGGTTFDFYLEGRVGQNNPLLGKLIERSWSGYIPAWRVVNDPEWNTYTTVLQSDAYAIQQIMNRRLLDRFTKMNDATDVPRVVDHLAFFASREAAEAAGSKLKAVGFSVETPTASEDTKSGWSLSFHREDHLSDGRADEFVVEILDIILPLDGDYDGWGATNVEKK